MLLQKKCGIGGIHYHCFSVATRIHLSETNTLCKTTIQRNSRLEVRCKQSEIPQTRNDPESETRDESYHSLFDPTTVYTA